jgi:hypothetical protein
MLNVPCPRSDGGHMPGVGGTDGPQGPARSTGGADVPATKVGTTRAN